MARVKIETNAELDTKCSVQFAKDLDVYEPWKWLAELLRAYHFPQRQDLKNLWTSLAPSEMAFPSLELCPNQMLKLFLSLTCADFTAQDLTARWPCCVCVMMKVGRRKKGGKVVVVWVPADEREDCWVEQVKYPMGVIQDLERIQLNYREAVKLDAAKFNATTLGLDQDYAVVLKELWKCSQVVHHGKPKGHVQLILSAELHSIPWEATERLLGNTVNRALSLAHLAAKRSVSSMNLAYVVNPENDSKCESIWSNLKDAVDKSNNDGVHDEMPTEERMLGLLQKDVLLFSGHGDGCAAITDGVLSTAEKLPHTFLLMGCQSAGFTRKLDHAPGVSLDGRTFELASMNCRVLGLLWPVTSTELDAYTNYLLKDITQLEEKHAWHLRKNEGTTLPLHHLVGSAFVLYGPRLCK